jgi:hypothetical protein
MWPGQSRSGPAARLRFVHSVMARCKEEQVGGVRLQILPSLNTASRGAGHYYDVGAPAVGNLACPSGRINDWRDIAVAFDGGCHFF